ncbi:MAG TPA: hypothetical protein VK196_08260 [Magnetospirillum sp.]|nr:hypothetical protein [Magnetospirillum sp.]
MMQVEKSSDDVVRIRVDAAMAVQEFLDLLSAQAAEGETRAPANPANRAVFRELAPYRLVEYAYVDAGIGNIDGVYLGFPDGSIYSVTDEVPEAVVDAMVQGEAADLPPVYLYVVLAEPRSPRAIDHFLRALAVHLDKGLVGVFRDETGAMAARAYDGSGHAGAVGQRSRCDSAAVKSVLEADRHLTRQRIVERYAARSESADGRAWAQITYNFNKHVIEFQSAADRNDFVAWSRTLCEWVYARWCSWEDLGFGEILRPAEVAPAPKGEIVAVKLLPPAKAQDGRPWRAFGGTSAATAKPFGASQAATDQQALIQSLAMAREYWTYCTQTIDSVEFIARQRAEAEARLLS